MAIKPEEIRKAKKFLENKKLSIKTVKPRIFAKWLLKQMYLLKSCLM